MLYEVESVSFKAKYDLFLIISKVLGLSISFEKIPDRPMPMTEGKQEYEAFFLCHY